jgi:hypothetical protein
VRTTVILDDGVVAALRRVEWERGVSFKDALNSAVRAGLALGGGSASSFTIAPFAAEFRPGVDLARAKRLLADLEDDESARDLELRK